MTTTSDHRYEPDTDRCKCGGVVVYFDTWPGDPVPERGVGEGCEVFGFPWGGGPK